MQLVLIDTLLEETVALGDYSNGGSTCMLQYHCLLSPHRARMARYLYLSTLCLDMLRIKAVPWVVKESVWKHARSDTSITTGNDFRVLFTGQRGAQSAPEQGSLLGSVSPIGRAMTSDISV